MEKTNGALKIERGIPIPSTGFQRGELYECLKKMKVGESVLVKGNVSSIRVKVHEVLGAGNFATRKTDDGLRIWRTK